MNPPSQDRDRFRHAVEARDLEAMTAAFAENANMNSPAVLKPIEGRAAICRLLAVLLEVFEDFDYTDELVSDDGTKALVFDARVGDTTVQGMDLLRFDDSARITELTVMVRPRKALETLMAEVGARLAAAAQR